MIKRELLKIIETLDQVNHAAKHYPNLSNELNQTDKQFLKNLNYAVNIYRFTGRVK